MIGVIADLRIVSLGKLHLIHLCPSPDSVVPQFLQTLNSFFTEVFVTVGVDCTSVSIPFIPQVVQLSDLVSLNEAQFPHLYII